MPQGQPSKPRQGRCPELVEGKEVPEALSNRNGECAIAIFPSRIRSKRHLAPRFVVDRRTRGSLIFRLNTGFYETS